jgi:hypothetical protein
VTVRAKREKLAWIALAIVLMVVGCGTSATQSPPTLTPMPVPPTETPEPTAAPALAFPKGVFAKASLTWEFKPDGTYIKEGHTAAMAGKYSGTYTVTGDQVVVQDDDMSCKGEGIYAWTYDGEVLTLTEVDDKCRDRAGMTWGKWRKNP